MVKDKSSGPMLTHRPALIIYFDLRTFFTDFFTRFFDALGLDVLFFIIGIGFIAGVDLIVGSCLFIISWPAMAGTLNNIEIRAADMIVFLIFLVLL